MASLNWISPRSRSPFLRGISHIPYILGDDDEYIDGMNLWLQERCSGRIQLSKGIVNNIATYQRSRNTIRAIGYNLTYFAGWLYCAECHPDHGVIHWTDVARWHVEDLYREHMVQGFWTQEYWATANKFSLNFPTTIRTRLREVEACYEWLATESLVDWPKATPPLPHRQEALRNSIAALTNALPGSMQIEPGEPKYKRRQDPGDWSPLTPDQLKALVKYIDKPVGELTVRLYLWTGMRLNELIENTLVPGSLHLRSAKLRALAEPTFPQVAYQLRYDVRDNRMIGVLPDEKAAFESGEKMLPLRILGKGDKIRTVHVPGDLMRAIWRYYVLKRPKVSTEHNSAMFINKRGKKLAAWSVSYAISEAKKKILAVLGEDIPITPHVLRHTFACLSLEAVLSGRAREEGHDPSHLTQDQIERYGGEAVVVIQELLGHAMAKDTARYLKQLSKGKAGLRYLEFFSAAMKETLGNDASF